MALPNLPVLCVVLQKAVTPTHLLHNDCISVWFQVCVQRMFCAHASSSWGMLSSTLQILFPDDQHKLIPALFNRLYEADAYRHQLELP